MLPGGGQHGGDFSLSKLVPDVGAGEGDKMWEERGEERRQGWSEVHLGAQGCS